MARIHRIDDERSAVALADLLCGNTRKRPVVVVTIAAGRDASWIDAEEIAREVGALAEVYLMPTGAFTWGFSDRMPEGTQVYGGAGRAYPPGHEWVSDLAKSPLRFAFNPDDGRRATQQLLSDTLRMVAAAGLLRSLPSRELRQINGTVTGVIAGRALVNAGNALPAAIAEELTVADVPIRRIVTAGQKITGWYDPETNRVDVTGSLRPSEQALAVYSPGDVVLTKVARVRSDEAELTLYPAVAGPAVTVTVAQAEVTTNPLDDLRTLMTLGEVIPARVVDRGPAWRLVLNDVEDDEPIVEAPSLLDGGPPWLVEDGDDPVEEKPVPLLPGPQERSTASKVLSEPLERPIPTAQIRPTPALLDRNRTRPTPAGPTPTESTPTESTPTQPAPAEPAPAEPTPAEPAPAEPTPADPTPTVPIPRPVPPTRPIPTPPPRRTQPAAETPPPESTRKLLLKIDGLNAEIAGLKREQQRLQTQLLAAAQEHEQLRYLRDRAEHRANGAEHDLKAARSRLRKAGTSKAPKAGGQGPRFSDPEQGFRYLVLTQWATRTHPSEQPTRPLPDFHLSPQFLDSLQRLEGIKVEKVADVVFEIVTGLARQNPSREIHRLRTGMGGEDAVRVREDGSIAWRASLQVKTPSARRIHYWVLPNGGIEFARVTTHDDFEA